MAEVRRRIGLNQARFARILGISQSYYAEMEKEKKPLNKRVARSICTLFGIREEWLLEGKGEMEMGRGYCRNMALLQEWADTQDRSMQLFVAYINTCAGAFNQYLKLIGPEAELVLAPDLDLLQFYRLLKRKADEKIRGLKDGTLDNSALAEAVGKLGATGVDQMIHSIHIIEKLGRDEHRRELQRYLEVLQNEVMDAQVQSEGRSGVA